ncbi:hypothetical protein ACIF8T_40280 [Streptomyces sp. NPDC085946]|uniref:hypothetical protein n=1 Tax=Streptomyces sp. NPDC085946 TaxID=3365744 RepID=UPI0037D7D8AC
MLNGKRLPRWETVEPVAWALGGEAAVAACRQRWIEADAARTVTTPAAPRSPADLSAAPATKPTEPVPNPAEPHGGTGSPDRFRRRWPAMAGAAAMAAAALALSTLLPDSERSPHPDTSASKVATRFPSHTAENQAAIPLPSPSSPSSLLTPGTTLLTAHSSRPSSTRDGLVTISVLSVDGNDIPGVVYSVITPWTGARSRAATSADP